MRLRSREVATRWIAAGHSLTRLSKGLGQDTRGLPEWIAELLAEHGSLPPVGVVTDMGQLFAGLPLMEAVPLPAVNPRLRTALRAYEDHVLGRMAASPLFEATRDAFSALPPELRSRATTILVQRFLERIGFEGGASLSLGLVREVIRAPRNETIAAGLEALNESGEVVERIASSLEELTSKSRRCAVLLNAADVFLVEHVAVLGELTQRLLIAQLAEVQAAFSDALPKRLKSRRKPLRAKVSTDLAADAQYPAGGFSSISNSGSLENLVISELIYMDDGDEESENVDLFDLRYAEGELLYYTRDDAFFLRDQRVVQFVFESSLVGARSKDRELDWQRLVVSLGLVACVIEKLAEWLGAEQGLLIRLAFVANEKGQEALSVERQVLEIFVSDWIERGVVEVQRTSSLEALLPELAECSQAAEVELISLGCGEEELCQEVPGQYQLARLRVDGDTPHLRWRHEAESEHPASSHWQAWRQAALQLLRELI